MTILYSGGCPNAYFETKRSGGNEGQSKLNGIRIKRVYSGYNFCDSLRLFIPRGFNIFLSPVPELSFLSTHIGAESGRAKEESRIICMRMLRTPPFFPPKSGEKPYLEVLFRFGLWRDFLNDNIQATISVFRLIKNMSINPKSVEFHLYHAKPLGLESARAVFCK